MVKPNVIHSLDAQHLNKMPQELKEANEEHRPVIKQSMCMHCGKKNGGHYIMCSTWVD